jgi:hypothetical protein
MLVKLVLMACDICPASILKVTATCHHLKVLFLINVRVIVPEGDVPLTPAAGAPSLDLVMHNITPSPPAQHWPFSLVQTLGPRLAYLEYACSGTSDAAQQQEVEQLLKVAHEGHLSGLTHLLVLSLAKGAPLRDASMAREYLRSLPEACPRLQSLRVQRMWLPNWQLLATFMAMPDLQELEIFSPFDVDGDASASPLAINWPAGKPRMSLRFLAVLTSQLHAMPLRHVSRVTCHIMALDAIPGSTPAGECRKLRSLLEVLETSDTEVRFTDLLGKGGFISSCDLSALPEAGTRLQLWRPQYLGMRNISLVAADMQAVAATWGSGLESLSLISSLSGAAWAAVTATAFPKLHDITVAHVYLGQFDSSGIHLTALCLTWPRDRHLKVTIKQFGNAPTDQLADTCSAALTANGITNIDIVAEMAQQA